MVTLKPGRSVYLHPIMLLLGLAMFCVFFNVYGQYSFLATYLYDAGYTTEQVGMIGFWNGLIGLISTPHWRLGRRRADPPGRSHHQSPGLFHGGCGVPGGRPGLPAHAHAGPGEPEYGGAAGADCRLGLPGGQRADLLAAPDVFGAKIGGGAVGFVLLIAGAGGVIAPIIVPAISASFGWHAGWYLTAASAFVGLAVCLLTPTLAGRSGQQG